MKTPTPIVLLVFALALIYRGLVAFFPSLRGENKKQRKAVPKLDGSICLLVGLLGVLYSVYVIYVFAGGSVRIFSIENEALFRSADLLLLAFIFVPIVILFFKSIFNRKKDSEN